MGNNGCAHLIQIDTSVNKGSSGSPLLNCNNEVIDVIAFSLVYRQFSENIDFNFAISSNEVKAVINNTLLFKHKPKPNLNLLTIDTDSNISEAVGLNKETRFLIFEVLPDSVLIKAGIKVVDII